MPTYNKLIRDRIPEIIEKTGKQYSSKNIEQDELLRALKVKLEEEVQEFQNSDNDLGELADVLEVIEALAEHLGSSFSEVRGIQERKRSERGGFSKGILLEWVED